MNNIQRFVDHLCTELQATQLSLLLYVGVDADRQVGLFSTGSADPAPELKDLDTAQHLINGALASRKVELFRSADPQCHLLCVPVSARAPENLASERRLRAVNAPGFWLSVRNCADEQRLSDKFDLIASSVRVCAELFASQTWRADRDTGLPDRGEFERVLETQLNSSEQRTLDLGLMLIEPKPLDAEVDASLLQRAQTQLHGVLRESDQLYRYANSVLALALPGIDQPGLNALANKVALALRNQNSDTPLHWSVVSLHCEADALRGLRSVDCARQLERALHRCKVQSGDQRESLNTEALTRPDSQQPLQGMFTGEATRDYRNMRLLWDVVERIGQCNDARQLSDDFAKLTSQALVMPVALYERTELSIQRLASHGLLLQDNNAIAELCRAALDRRDTVSQAVDQCSCFGFPSVVEISAPMVLIVCDQTKRLLDCDQRLLEGLVQQLAYAIERLKINAQESDLRETEARFLRQQVTMLSQHASAPEPICDSEAMQHILRQARLWAPTDETILISGESGAGKEIMAAQLHRLSQRANAPMVTVDCAAIPATLLEAELFGKVKGAYTGADSSSEGYARKADGGTLFLDEVGELPIDVQAKLLRFVQEKQVSPVGSSDVYSVDVRIVAATNRDLRSEVETGRFRGDLMYRLRVLEIHLPPLRARQADIIPLAQHFLDLYNQQYQRQCTLTPQAQTRLQSYGWPGNVRELKHSMLKACLECADERITPMDIGFAESYETTPHALKRSESTSLLPPSPQNSTLPEADDVWDLLQHSLRASCAKAVSQDLRLPFGTWVTEALVRAANAQSNGIAKHGALLLGMPESTYRRQLERIKQSDQSGLAVQHPLFEPNIELLQRFLAEQTAQSHTPTSSLVDRVREQLLLIIDALVPEKSSLGAALMGVTPPTYRRHLQDVREGQP